MSKIEDSVLPNPKFNIKELPIAYFSERKDSELLNRQFIKNTTKQAEEELTELSVLFFSDENIDLINKQIVLKVFKLSNKSYKIPFQSKESLLIVMRHVWIIYSRNLDFHLKKQIKELNDKVACEVAPQIITNVDQYYGYLRDIETRNKSNFNLIDLPKNSNTTEKTFPSISEVFHSGYKAPF